MMVHPSIPDAMLITLMDRYGRKSHEIRQHWSDAFKFWLCNEMRVYHGWFTQRVMDIVYLRVASVCEKPGRSRDLLHHAAAELAQQFVSK